MLMKLRHTIAAFAFISGLTAGFVYAEDQQKDDSTESRKAKCCEKAGKEDKGCSHECCVEAAKAGKNCEKCGGADAKKEKAPS